MREIVLNKNKLFIRGAITLLMVLVSGVYFSNVYGGSWQKGTLENNNLTEISGLIASPQFDNVLYGINDSGNNPIVYRLDKYGKDLGEIEIKGAKNTDWEAISIGNCEFAEKCLFIADIGDNKRSRKKVRIYIVPEPSQNAKVVQVAKEVEFTYPDVPHDAESLFIDNSGHIYVIQKNIREDIYSDVPIYSIMVPKNTDKRVKSFAFLRGYINVKTKDGAYNGPFTDAVMGKDNNLYIRDYRKIYRTHWIENSLPPNLYKITLEPIESPAMTQGESLAILNDGKTLITASEGRHELISPFANDKTEK
jgi:hypothetical protein